MPILKHRMSNSRLYGVWRAMLDRCYSEWDYHFKWYGARGISVCDRWRFGEAGKHGLECWIEDMGPKPTPKHTLERVNNGGNYEPSNCIWATRMEQARNKRPRRLETYVYVRKLTAEQVIAIRGDLRPQKEIAAQYHVSSSAISMIKCRRNWKHLP